MKSLWIVKSGMKCSPHSFACPSPRTWNKPVKARVKATPERRETTTKSRQTTQAYQTKARPIKCKVKPAAVLPSLRMKAMWMPWRRRDKKYPRTKEPTMWGRIVPKSPKSDAETGWSLRRLKQATIPAEYKPPKWEMHERKACKSAWNVKDHNQRTVQCRDRSEEPKVKGSLRTWNVLWFCFERNAATEVKSQAIATGAEKFATTWRKAEYHQPCEVELK